MYILQVKQYLSIFWQENSSLSVQVFLKSYIAKYRHKASNLTVGKLFSFVAFCSSSYYKTKVSCEFDFREASSHLLYCVCLQVITKTLATFLFGENFFSFIAFCPSSGYKIISCQKVLKLIVFSFHSFLYIIRW